MSKGQTTDMSKCGKQLRITNKYMKKMTSSLSAVLLALIANIDYIIAFASSLSRNFERSVDNV